MNNVLPLLPIILPSVPFDKRETLPAVIAIYFALSHSGQVLYVGATRNLQQRWKGHHKFTQLQENGCTHIAYLLCEEDELYSLEGVMIRQFHPPYNGTWSPIPPRRLLFMEEKPPQSYRLTAEAKRLLALLALAKGLTPRTILEMLIRDEAERRGIK